MSDDANSGNGSGRRRRRRRGRKRGGGGGNNSNNNRGNSSGNRRNNSRKNKTPREKFGGRDPKNVSAVDDEAPSTLDAFELFCSYHLGIFEGNQYRQPSLKQVARRFDRSQDEIRDALAACGLDDKTVRQADYDLSLAQLDVRVAPEGIDKRELAKGLFEEFVAAHPGFVEWTEESAEG